MRAWCHWCWGPISRPLQITRWWLYCSNRCSTGQ